MATSHRRRATGLGVRSILAFAAIQAACAEAHTRGDSVAPRPALPAAGAATSLAARPMSGRGAPAPAGNAGTSAAGSSTSGTPVTGGESSTPTRPPESPAVPNSSQTTSSAAVIGWAAEPGDAVATTTGGAAGPVVTVSSPSELMDQAARKGPLTILVQGTLKVPRLELTSDKTLVGADANATIEGGIRIRGKSDAFVSNVIVRNLKIHAATSDVDGDGIQVHYAHHVVIDHCEVWDAADGELDIVHASNWVTVSFTKFWYSDATPDPKHRFANLVGHSDGNDEDKGRLKVTFHHNWWGPAVIERMPRVRYGEVHVFNNYYSAGGNNYAIGGGLEARLLIEANEFDHVRDPHRFYDHEPTAQIVARDNEYTEASGVRDTGQGPAFTPPYHYEPEAANTVRDRVMREAGPK